MLQDARLRRARLDGVGEFEWDPPEPEFVAEKDVELPVDPPEHVPVPRRPEDSAPASQSGYAKLFGGQFPSFTKATEPQK